MSNQPLPIIIGAELKCSTEGGILREMLLMKDLCFDCIYFNIKTQKICTNKLVSSITPTRYVVKACRFKQTETLQRFLQ